MTCRALDAAKAPYALVSLDDDAEALAYVKSLGYMAAPVVVDRGHWSGFRPDLLKAATGNAPEGPGNG